MVTLTNKLPFSAPMDRDKGAHSGGETAQDNGTPQQSHDSSRLSQQLNEAGFGTHRDPSLDPSVIQAQNDRLRYWVEKYGVNISPADLDRAKAISYLDPLLCRNDGISLSTAHGRAALWNGVPPREYRAVLLACMMTHAPALDEVSGGVVKSPQCLPPLDFLLGILKDPGTSSDTRQWVYSMIADGAYRPKIEQRAAIAADLGAQLKSGSVLTPHQKYSMDRFGIKDNEVGIHSLSA